LLNAAAAMVAAGIASSFGEGVDQARETIGSGAAAATLAKLIQASRA
jgi:anthranilate phosphoribosyltransferase